MTSNAVVVPVYQTFTLLFEADVLRHLPDELSGLQRLARFIALGGRGILT